MLRRLVALALALVGCGTREPSWTSIQRTIDERFPDVRQLDTAELARRLEDEQRPLLLDVRTANEYAVSHLPGARRAATLEAALAAIADAPGRPVVTYCSVGYRSSELAQRLAERGIDDVANLRGSIFAWANEGRALVRDGRPAERVHPYDERWGRLLERARWPERFEPPDPD